MYAVFVSTRIYCYKLRSTTFLFCNNRLATLHNLGHRLVMTMTCLYTWNTKYCKKPSYAYIVVAYFLPYLIQCAIHLPYCMKNIILYTTADNLLIDMYGQQLSSQCQHNIASQFHLFPECSPATTDYYDCCFI